MKVLQNYWSAISELDDQSPENIQLYR